jgi:hypothetical protein
MSLELGLPLTFIDEQIDYLDKNINGEEENEKRQVVHHQDNTHS